MALNDRQQRFVTEYLKDLNATEAAIRAGYSVKTAKQIGSRLLTQVDVAAAIAAATAKRLSSADLTATRVLEEMRRLAFSDLRSLFDDKGNLRPIHTLTAEQAACIAGMEVIVKNAQAGDGHTDTIHKIKCWDKPKTLEMLGKHFALLIERVELRGGDELIARLKAGQRNNAAADTHAD